MDDIDQKIEILEDEIEQLENVIKDYEEAIAVIEGPDYDWREHADEDLRELDINHYENDIFECRHEINKLKAKLEKLQNMKGRK